MPRAPKLIPVERDEIPAFSSEAEEHTFWKTHEFGPGLLAEMRSDGDPELPSASTFQAHITERRAGSGERSQPIPIRFDADVLRRLRNLAAHKHTGYQTLLKMFIVERLYEEEKREGLR